MFDSASISSGKTDFIAESSDDKPPQRAETVHELLARLGGDMEEIDRVKKVYPMKISSHFLALIQEKGDPIWKQAVPSAEELSDFRNVADPLSEGRDTKVPGLIHRYPDRVLLMVSSKCAMYCRFCTRKRSVGRVEQTPMQQIFQGIDYIRGHPEVKERPPQRGEPLLRSNGPGYHPA